MELAMMENEFGDGGTGKSERTEVDFDKSRWPRT